MVSAGVEGDDVGAFQGLLVAVLISRYKYDTGVIFYMQGSEFTREVQEFRCFEAFVGGQISPTFLTHPHPPLPLLTHSRPPTGLTYDL